MSVLPVPKPITAQEGPQTQFLSSPADIVVYGGAAYGGKLLALDTPVPTPEGWTTMGALVDGQAILDADGQPCNVVKAHQIEEDPESFRLTFDDGEVILAGSEHLWHTFTSVDLSAMSRRTEAFRASRRSKRKSRATGNRGKLVSDTITKRNKEHVPPAHGMPHGDIRTTFEIFQSLTDNRGRPNHHIPTCRPLSLPERNLPLDPYLLGIWLGDGTTCSSGITTADLEIVEAFRNEGFHVQKWKDKYGWGVHGLVSILRRIGVLNNKHVPMEYLRASFGQRLSILQGLMDSDGHACTSGGSEFTSTKRCLADAVAELVHSIGGKARVCEGRATLNGRDCGPKYRVKWSCSIPVFRLARKAARQNLDCRRSTRMRSIVKCERIPSIPMRCITVDSPSRLYLAGRGMIPTHNTYGLLMEPSRHIANKDFTFTIFRRSIPQIDNQGALWDESYKIYPMLGGVPIDGNHIWRFPSGAEGKFAHLQEDKTIYDYDGAQIPLIEFDQLEQFTEKQFFYMMSRNRSGCGVRPYIRASANPPPNRGHWLRSLVDWWIGEDGFPIKERSGILRYFTRDGNQVVWVDEDWRDPEGEPPQSFTFIGAKYTDNKIGLEKDPKYVSKLNMQDRVDKQRLKEGNWNAIEEGALFTRDDFKIIDRIPDGMRLVRYWDRAATEKTVSNTPDWTAGALCGEYKGALVIVHMEHFQGNPLQNEQRIAGCAEIDGPDVEIYMECEGGSAGKDVVSHYQRNVLRGYIVHGDRPTGDKRARAKPWCALSQNGNVLLVRGSWNHDFLAEVETFPFGKKDQVDAVSGANKVLLGDQKGSIEDLVTE